MGAGSRMSPRILVIDDDDDTHLFLKLTLQPHGHQVIGAHSVTQGLNAARRENPDLIVLEAAIENGAGFDLCRRLRLLPGGRARPILIVSRLRDREDLVRGLEHGASAYLTKPADPTELVVRVHMLLRYDQAPRPTVILVVGAKGGVGATTIAVNLGVALARRWREKVALIDAEFPGGDPAVQLDLRPTHTLADLVSYGQSVDVEMVEGVLQEHSSGLRLLSAPIGVLDELPPPDFLVPIIHLMSGHQTYVIVDMPASMREHVEVTARLADHILVVVVPELTALSRAGMLLDSLTRRLDSDVETHPQFCLVLNQVGRGGSILVDELPEDLKAYPSVRIRYDARRVLASINAGVPLVLRSPRSAIARELVQLAQSLRRPDPAEEHSTITDRIRAVLGRFHVPRLGED